VNHNFIAVFGMDGFKAGGQMKRKIKLPRENCTVEELVTK